MDTNRSFQLGYSDATWGDMPGLEEAMSAIAAAGWEGVEIRNASIDWLGTPRRLRSLIDKHDLIPVSMFGSLSLGGDSSQVLTGLPVFASETGVGESSVCLERARSGWTMHGLERH